MFLFKGPNRLITEKKCGCFHGFIADEYVTTKNRTKNIFLREHFLTESKEYIHWVRELLGQILRGGKRYR